MVGQTSKDNEAENLEIVMRLVKQTNIYTISNLLLNTCSKKGKGEDESYQLLKNNSQSRDEKFCLCD